MRRLGTRSRGMQLLFRDVGRKDKQVVGASQRLSEETMTIAATETTAARNAMVMLISMRKTERKKTYAEREKERERPRETQRGKRERRIYEHL